MRGAAVVFLALALGACRGSSPATGRFDLQWTGADTGKMRLPAVAHWCGDLGFLEVAAIADDSGAAVAVFPSGAVTPGVYPVVPPGDDRLHPSASMALRRIGINMVYGYYSLSGVVRLDSGLTSGSVEATLKSVTDGDQLTLTGRFRGLTLDSVPYCAASPGDSAAISIR